MRKSILALVGSLVIAAPTTLVAAAARPHHSHVADHRGHVKTRDRWHNSNAYMPPVTQPEVFDTALSPPAGR
jgi:hypothetical protein